MALSFARGAWFYIYTVTGTCIENITQAISRDILCYAMKTLSHCRIVGHVHDELIIDVGKDASLKAICEQMSRSPEWLPGIELKADGYECGFYMKA